MNKAPANNAPPLGFMLAHDDDISEQAKPSQGSSQPDRLPTRVINRWLDYQEVKIAVRAGVAARMRPEQDNLRSWWRRLRQAPSSLLDRCFIEQRRERRDSNPRPPA
jgi:hypothetical protein